MKKKKVISAALFGDGDKYAQYVSAFVLGALNLFPPQDGWVVRLHVDDVVRRSPRHRVLDGMDRAGLIQLKYMLGEPLLTRAMLWRLAPVFDEGVEYVFSRDLDAPPMPRDRAACEQFIVSKCALHTVHDNLAHSGVMGGLCGFWAPEFRRLTGIDSLTELYKFADRSDEQWREHGTDQHVLNRISATKINLTLLEHRFNGWTEGRPTDYRREASTYGCQDWSCPTPDAGQWDKVGSYDCGSLRLRADQLGNHLGCAGYDHLAARHFWETHGNEEYARALRACEVEG